MGCSAAKNVTVESLDGNNSGELSNGNGVRKVSVPNLSVPPLEGEDLQAELLESATVNNIQKGQNGLSFDIAFEEEGNEESIIKKHPPKRFQRLEEQPTSPITLDKLQEKLEEAEIRRQQILAQRVQSAKVRNQLRKQSSIGSNSAEDDPDHLKVPPEVPPKTPNPYDVAYV
ncbi:uncharacterized protein LOC108913415 [Anoplophora glabripennis]|uniref:uncharacterized protein LOC108913415 n=1 Tax=Anoplophora glabripennis TaxID=217634 RepID=UPI0008744ED8|nr:uncharacterized protein LOC108913415 [Anoplophora glabripennis]